MKNVTVKLGPGLKEDAELQSVVARASNAFLDAIPGTPRPVVAEWDTAGGNGKGLLSLRLTDSMGSVTRFFTPDDLTSDDPSKQAFTRIDLRGLHSALLREACKVMIRELHEPTEPEPEGRPALAAQNAQ